jgi:selenide,water dikinase
MAVTGVANPDRLLRNDSGRPGMPLTLTKPLGLGVLNNRHKATGERFEAAIETMTTLNAAASVAALEAGATAATDITGFGLLGHLHKMARASGCAAVIDGGSVPYLEGARGFADEGYIPGGSKRNLDWVRPHLSAHGIGDIELMLLADAQTSGGLLVGAELAGYPVIGELVDGPAGQITIR